MTTKESEAAAGTAGHRKAHRDSSDGSATARPTQAPRKWTRVLGALAAGRTLNRFEAARELRDWCLPSTVSELEKRDLTILRKSETVPGSFGPVHCARYWLSPASLERANQLLQEARAAAT